MKKIVNTLRMAAVLSDLRLLAGVLVAGAVMSACSGNDLANEIPSPDAEPQPAVQPAPKTFTMTIAATKGGAADTRALTLGIDPDTGTPLLDASWSAGDEVTVFNVTTSTALGGVLTAADAGASTTLSGMLTGDISAGDELRLEFLSPDYDLQDGTLDFIAAHCDYAEATVTVASTDGGSITATAGADFQNRQAIVRFSLKDKGGNAFVGDSLTIDFDGRKIRVKPATPTNMLYVAIPGIDSKTVSLYSTTASTATDVYSYTREGVTFADGQFYTIGVRMSFDALATPLTIQAVEDGDISFRNKAAGAVTYRVNGGEPQTIDSGVTADIPVQTNDKVAFYGDNDQYGAGSLENSSNFSGINFDAYGNIMSLITSTDYLTAEEFSRSSSIFAYLFSQSGVNMSKDNPVILPALIMKDNCYESMFDGCKRLVYTPALPSRQLAYYCYQCMFKDCTSLIKAPDLNCGVSFPYCYYKMFQGCTSLKTPPQVLCGGGKIFYCCSYMFAGCTSLTASPTLFIKELANGCYAYMFNGCSSLSSVRTYAQSNNGGTSGWLSRVAKKGNFEYYYPGIFDSDSPSGIPKGWTINGH